MVSSTLNASEDNNFGSNQNLSSIVTAITEKTFALISEYILKAGLDEGAVSQVIAGITTNLGIDLGRKLLAQKEQLKPKEKFCDLAERLEMSATFMGKLIRAAQTADNFPSTIASLFGIDVLAQLKQPRYTDLMDDLINHPPASQLEVSDRMKEFNRSQPKKPETPWKYVGAQKTSDGLAREYQVPRVSETVGLAIERESELSNLPPHMIVEKAIQAFVEPDRRVDELQIAVEEGLLYKEKFQMIALRTEKFEAEIKELRGIKAENMQLEEQAQQVEAIACNLVEQFPSILFFLSLITYIKPLTVTEDVMPPPIRKTMVARSKPKQTASEKIFEIGEMVSYSGALYTITSEPDEDGDVQCLSASGQTRHLKPRFLNPCNAS